MKMKFGVKTERFSQKCVTWVARFPRWLAMSISHNAFSYELSLFSESLSWIQVGLLFSFMLEWWSELFAKLSKWIKIRESTWLITEWIELDWNFLQISIQV